MGRLLRFLLEDHCYHVTTRTRGGAPVFRDPANVRIIVDTLQFVRSERAYLLAYAIMPDHVHAVLVPKNGYTISQVMQTVKGYTSRAINARNRDRGPLWQRSFYDRIIRDEAQLADTIRYVHENPVVEGLVENPEAYPFSSAGTGAGVDLAEFLSG